MRISLEQTASYLKDGYVVAIPTETVYGLAACLNSSLAIEKIFALKGRPLSNPLIIHVADHVAIADYAGHYPPQFENLANVFWPGPLTIILPVNARVPAIARAGLPTAAFRVPAHALTRSLLHMTGPLVMPSANLSGRPSATSYEHVEEDFGIDFPVLDGGRCQKGVESTILFYEEREWVIVRLGAIAPLAFEPILGYQPRYHTKKSGNAPLCPGQLYRHYAPRARLLLGQSSRLDSASFVIGFNERRYPQGKRIILLGSLSNPDQIAESLYSSLRQLDLEGAEEAWVDMDFPRDGLWETIAERLMRAGEN